MAVSARMSARSLNALSFGPATDEFLDERLPVPALAEQALDELAERAATSPRLEFPPRRRAHLGRGVGRRGRDRDSLHRSEVRKVVAGVEDLCEREPELLREPLRLFEFAGRSLAQLGDAELARAALQRRRTAAGHERDRDPDALRELHGQPVADVELLHLALLAEVDDLAVGP